MAELSLYDFLEWIQGYGLHVDRYSYGDITYCEHCGTWWNWHERIFAKQGGHENVGFPVEEVDG